MNTYLISINCMDKEDNEIQTVYYYPIEGNNADEALNGSEVESLIEDLGNEYIVDDCFCEGKIISVGEEK